MNHFPAYLESGEADNLFAQLLELQWRKTVWNSGRELPRLTFSYDEAQPNYALERLIGIVQENFKVIVKGVWCNLYRTGEDWTPPHKDNHGEHVFTFSFGASRRFVLLRDHDKTKQEFILNHGDLFWFNDETNRNYRHSIPKTKKTVGIRISVVLFA